MHNIPTFEEVMSVTRSVSSSTVLEDPEARALYDACIEVPEDGVVVEVGCQIGRSSSLITQLQQAIGFHAIHVDPYISNPEYLKGWVEMMARAGDFALLCMRTEQAAWHLDKIGTIDMAFIDGDHEYQSVKLDLQLVANRIKRGGLLTAHDYANEGLPGVRQAIDPYVATGWDEIGIFGSLGVWRKQ